MVVEECARALRAQVHYCPKRPFRDIYEDDEVAIESTLQIAQEKLTSGYMIGKMKEERACNCRTASDSSLEVQPVLELIMNGWLHQAFFTTDRSLLGDIDSYLEIITKRV